MQRRNFLIAALSATAGVVLASRVRRLPAVWAKPGDLVHNPCRGPRGVMMTVHRVDGDGVTFSFPGHDGRTVTEAPWPIAKFLRFYPTKASAADDDGFIAAMREEQATAHAMTRVGEASRG